MRILTKCKLDFYASHFTSDKFPSKHQWKRFCKTAVRNHKTSLWKARLDTSRDFELCKQIHPQMHLSSIWSVARVRPQSLALMKQPVECHICLLPCDIQIEHSLFDYSLSDQVQKRNDFTLTLVNFGSPFFELFRTLPNKTFLTYILGYIDENLTNALDVSHFPDFLTLCAKLCNELC